jgi:hypothetical protein
MQKGRKKNAAKKLERFLGNPQAGNPPRAVQQVQQFVQQEN